LQRCSVGSKYAADELAWASDDVARGTPAQLTSAVLVIAQDRDQVRQTERPLVSASVLAPHRYAPGNVVNVRGLVISSANLETDYAELMRKGVEFEGPPQQRPWGIETVLRDPDGNRIVLNQS